MAVSSNSDQIFISTCGRGTLHSQQCLKSAKITSDVRKELQSSSSIIVGVEEMKSAILMKVALKRTADTQERHNNTLESRYTSNIHRYAIDTIQRLGNNQSNFA